MRNTEWELRMELRGVMILLLLSIIFNCWIWIKYDNEKKLREDMENYILHSIQTETIE